MSAAQGGRLDVVSTALSPFHLKLGKASKEIPALAKELAAKVVVCDMSPLRVPKQWASDVAKACEAQEARAHGHGKAMQSGHQEPSRGLAGAMAGGDAVALSFKLRGLSLEPLAQSKPLMKVRR